MYFKKGTWTKDTAVLASLSAAHRRPRSLRQKGPGVGRQRGPSVIHLMFSSLTKRKLFVPRCLVLIVMLSEVVV